MRPAEIRPEPPGSHRVCTNPTSCPCGALPWRLQSTTREHVTRHVLGAYRALMETYLADKVSLSSGELVEIGMSDLESPRSKRSERSIEKSTCRVGQRKGRMNGKLKIAGIATSSFGLGRSYFSGLIVDFDTTVSSDLESVWTHTRAVSRRPTPSSLSSSPPAAHASVR